ncbi:MAG: cystathionine beta-lyase [Alphaproteobacteria bacterium]
MTRESEHKADTLVTRLGRDPARQSHAVNPPVYHASTLAFDSVAEFEAAAAAKFDKGALFYGRYGMPTTFALESAVAELEGGYGAIAMSTGLAAITCSLLTFLRAGDHLLVTDTAYEPTRRVCDQLLGRFGVEVSYFDPLIGAGIAELIRPNTRLVYLESPGSITFEVQDVPVIAAAAHRAGLVVLFDNTWATPLYFKPFAHGVDVSIHAATKYIVGHADAMLGIIVSREEHYERLRRTAIDLGHAAAADDVYLALRGLRTLAVRMARHHKSALEIATWLQNRPEVTRVLYPALPGDPGHVLWRRDFTGASGLFGVVLAPRSKEAVAAMLDGLELFSLGVSWGGFESLVRPTDVAGNRTATDWEPPGPLLRFHIGLEDTTDLIADLEAGFARLNGASGVIANRSGT